MSSEETVRTPLNIIGSLAAGICEREPNLGTASVPSDASSHELRGFKVDSTLHDEIKNQISNLTHGLNVLRHDSARV